MARGTVLLCAGGTGGHLFPAEALAHALIDRGWRVHLVTDARAARFATDFPAQAVHAVEAATFGSRNPLALVRSGLTIWRGVRQASALIGRIRPQAVVGFGGYPTIPPLFAATRWGIPTLIHEQNAVMGRANKALARRVTAIAGGFLEPAGPYAGKIVVTGNPVRPAIIKASGIPYRPATPRGVFRLLVFGGSQGAQFFSDVFPQALMQLPDATLARLRVVQQARPEDEAILCAAYDAIGVSAEVSTFFTDMAQRIADAHLIISRSGASTVSEIAAIGRPAFLVPYPHALDHDQAANAAALQRAGGAEIIAQHKLTPERLRGLIDVAMRAPDKLSAMAEASLGVGRPHAAALLADLTEAIAAGESIASIRQGAYA